MSKWITILLLLCIGCAPIAGSKINGFALANRIHKQWPGLTIASRQTPGNVWMTDSMYFMPNSSEAKTVLRQGLPKTHIRDSSVFGTSQWMDFPPLAPSEDKNDCDDIAARTKVYAQDAFDGDAPLAMGIVDVNECFVRGKGNHSLNILVCEDMILLYDAEKDIIWSVRDADKPYFIRF